MSARTPSRPHTAPWRLALTALALCLGPCLAQAQPLPPAAETMPLALPPAPQAVAVIEQLPVVRAAQAGRAQAAARADRWQAGPHEWAIRLGAQQRREQAGPRYREHDWGLERGLRWPDKATTDRALGQNERTLGDLQFADAWHEAARGLLAAWFGWLRDARSAAVLAAQAELAQQQLDVANRRLRAGEAARLEQLMAQAEQQRAQAVARQAQLQADLQGQALKQRYPDLGLHLPQPLPRPAPLPDSDREWAQRILDDNHELELAEATARQAGLLAERSGRERRPDPVLGVRSSRERGGQEQVLGVYLSLPLAGDLRHANEREALAQAAQAEQQLADTRLRLQTAALRLAMQARQTQVAWASLDQARQAMQQAAALAQRAYALGETPLTDALQARRAALDAELAAEAQRLDALEHRARLQLDTHQLWQPPGGHHPAEMP